VSIFKRVSVMNGWSHGGWRYAWRFILLPIGRGVDGSAKHSLGYTTFSFFGFFFFWHHKLTPEQERMRRENSKKILEWVKKNGEQVE